RAADDRRSDGSAAERNTDQVVTVSIRVEPVVRPAVRGSDIQVRVAGISDRGTEAADEVVRQPVLERLRADVEAVGGGARDAADAVDLTRGRGRAHSAARVARRRVAGVARDAYDRRAGLAHTRVAAVGLGAGVAVAAARAVRRGRGAAH